MRSALFWDIMQRRLIIPYRRFGTTYRYHLQDSTSPKRIHFLNTEDGTDRLSRNVGTVFTALPSVISQTSADLVSPTGRVMRAALLRKSGDGNNPELRSNVTSELLVAVNITIVVFCYIEGT